MQEKNCKKIVFASNLWQVISCKIFNLNATILEKWRQYSIFSQLLFTLPCIPWKAVLATLSMVTLPSKWFPSGLFVLFESFVFDNVDIVAVFWSCGCFKGNDICGFSLHMDTVGGLSPLLLSVMTVAVEGGVSWTDTADPPVPLGFFLGLYL